MLYSVHFIKAVFGMDLLYFCGFGPTVNDMAILIYLPCINKTIKY